MQLNKLICADCMDIMQSIPDKYFDLAIVDPPYGINAPKMSMGSTKAYLSTATRLKKGRLNGGSGKLKKRVLNTMDCNWDDKPPPQEYFEELFRVSKNQIIWGGNYFNLPPSRGIVVWDKLQPWDNFSQFEMAWTSFDVPGSMFKFANRGGSNQTPKIHPTEKPIKLYLWLLNKYAKQGDKILDTHGGSCNSLIACHKLNFDYLGIEKNPNYWQQATDQLESAKQQISIFDKE